MNAVSFAASAGNPAASYLRKDHFEGDEGYREEPFDPWVERYAWNRENEVDVVRSLLLVNPVVGASMSVKWAAGGHITGSPLPVDFSLRQGKADFAEDVACCAGLARSGSALNFGSSGDGLDSIDDNTELVAVLNDSVSRVKVVRLINYCGGTGSNIIGCAWIGGDGMALVRYEGFVEVLATFGEPSDATALHALVDDLYADGATNFHDGLEAGLQMAANASDPERHCRKKPASTYTDSDRVSMATKMLSRLVAWVSNTMAPAPSHSRAWNSPRF